jgi:CHAD domain-containing protein
MSLSPLRYDLLHARVEVFARTLHGVGKGNPRAIHRMRLASRRLRELLPLLQLDQPDTRRLTRRLRRVTDRLGTVREADVLILLLDELHESGRYLQGGLTRLSAALREEREAARKRLDTKLPAGGLKRLAARLEELVHDLEPTAHAAARRDRAWRWALDARVTNRADALAAAMREAGAVYLAERLHVVRVALKKLRYAVELVNQVSGTRDADVKTLKRAQDLLGRMHDLQMLIDRIRQVQTAPPAELRAERELEAIADALENECRRLHARYVRERPVLAAICARSVARPAGQAPRRMPAKRAS